MVRYECNISFPCSYCGVPSFYSNYRIGIENSCDGCLDFIDEWINGITWDILGISRGRV